MTCAPISSPRPFEQGDDAKAFSEIGGSAPETIVRRYQHVTRKLHRKTSAKIPQSGIDNCPKRKG